MNPSTVSYVQLEANFNAWAQTQPDIEAALVIGSRARTDPPPDEWSDLDLILFVQDPAVYARDSAWLRELGDLWLAHHNRTFAGDHEWMALFAGGLKADFVLSRAVGPLQEASNQSPYHLVLRRGVRVLFNKAGPPDVTLPQAWFEPPPPPTEAEFAALLNHTFLTATRTARLLKRGELWQAKIECDAVLKRHLLAMIEWRAQARDGSALDTWYEGRFIERWAGTEELKAIPDTFAAYEAGDLWRALFASLNLFRRLAAETATHLGYIYPAHTDGHISAWLEAIRPNGR